MWPFRKKPAETPKPNYWVSPYYLAWRCNVCGTASSHESTTKEEPACCSACGCETFYQQVGRERKNFRSWYAAGQFYPRGLDVPLTD